MAALREVVIVDAIRTPVGKKGGTLSKVRSDDLGGIVLRELVRRNKLDPALIDDVQTGCVTQIGEQGANVGRNTVLASGLPVSVPATSVNRLCASSLQAFVNGVQAIACGYMDVVIALGLESMNRNTMGSDLGPLNPALMERFAIVPQGTSAELIAEKYGFSRSALDELALASQQRAMKAIGGGEFAREIVPVKARGDDGSTVELGADEAARETTMEKLAGLKPAFKADGVVTAGNSSQISDGAGGLLLMSAEKAKALGLRPRARMVTYAVAAVCPTIMLTATIPATHKALARAGLKIGDVGVVEVNEAFASVVLATAQDVGLDLARTNIRGGAIALGHPLGATGAILLTKTLHLLEDRKERYGLVTMCIGFGQGQTVIIERL